MEDKPATTRTGRPQSVLLVYDDIVDMRCAKSAHVVLKIRMVVRASITPDPKGTRPDHVDGVSKLLGRETLPEGTLVKTYGTQANLSIGMKLSKFQNALMMHIYIWPRNCRCTPTFKYGSIISGGVHVHRSTEQSPL